MNEMSQSNRSYYQTFSFKVIYVISIPYSSHQGRLKIGDTIFEGNPYNRTEMESAVRKRIDQYTKTADIEYNLLYFDLAITDKGTSFRDFDVHDLLKRSGIKQVSTTKGREWFEADLDTVIEAINAVKIGKTALGNIPGKELKEEKIIFRPEQEKAILETLSALKKNRIKNCGMLKCALVKL